MWSWGGRAKRSPEGRIFAASRRRRFLALAIAEILAPAVIAVGISSGPAAAGLSTAVTAEKQRVSVGETARLRLDIRGEGDISDYAIDQPELPHLSRFKILSVGQRNVVSCGTAAPFFIVTFIYTLQAQSAGDEIIPRLSVRYIKGGEKESRVISTDGLTLTVTGRAAAFSVRLAALAVAVGSIVIILLLLRRKRAGSPAVSTEVPAGPTAEKTSRAALECLAGMGEARRLKVKGDTGAYGKMLLRTLDGYCEADRDDGIARVRDMIASLCDGARYGRDTDAGRRIEESVRKAEVLLKEKIRKAAK